LRPFEYAIAAELLRSVGYAPSGMIEQESNNPVYFFYGESCVEMMEEASNIRDCIFARIATYLTVKITDADRFAEVWVRHKKLECSV
jgi:hypothetical protein